MKRKFTIIIGSILIATPILICLLLYTNRSIHQNDWEKRTTPLPKETKDLLCSRFELLPEDPLCSDNKNVYALDFVDIIRDTFRPYETNNVESSEAATYDDVEDKIGMFKYECESVETTGEGFSYFVCYYDLRGDRKFIIAIFYTYPDMAVMRINSTSRYYDY